MKELKGWMRPHELDPRDGRKPFDPVAEGSRYGLSQELSLAIWKRVCAEATDPNGQPDLEQAKRRFHAIAARIATRGGRWPYSDVGKRTRVETERDGSSSRGASMDELASRVPGRRTLVEAEASRWEPAGAAAIADAPGRRTLVEAEASRWKPTATAAIDQVVAAATDETREGIGTTAPSAPERRVAPASGEHRLPIPTLDRMERAFGRHFDDVEFHVDSGEVPTGIEAFTRGRHIFFGRGAFTPESAHGEHVIAHELAHVAQQSAPTAGGAPPTRAALEADAHQAALSALAGRAASVSLFAPAAAALGFSDGNAQHAPASGGSGGSSRSTPGAPGRTSGGSARAPASGGSAIPRPKPAPSAKAPPRPAGAAPGSSSVPAAPRRGAAADGLHIPEAPGALTPAAAGRLGTVQAGNQGNAAATTALPTGQQQTDVGRAAVEEPQAEQDARAQHGVVTDVDNRPPPSPEIEEACARIRQVIRDKRPPNEDKLVEAKPREMAQEAGNQMSAGVEQRAGTVRQGYADMQQPPPGSPSSAPVPPTLPPQHADTQPVDAGAAAPDPVNSEDVSLDADVADQKKQIEDAGMNTEPGKLVQDGPIGDARGGADELSEMAKTDPAKVIADQAAAIGKAKGDMRALQQAADKALADARAGTVDQMGKHTTGVKGSEEQQRAQAGEKMKGIFERAQKAVDGLLQPLSGNAVARWDAGVAQLSTEFEASLADVKRRIDERHSGALGVVTGIADWATGLPSWVTMGYDVAEAKFADGATSLIRDISRDVNAVIEDCKALIQQARKDIDAVVKSLPASLQTWAQGEAAKLNQQLDALDKRVDQAQKGVNKDLINRANSAVQEVREKVHELREAAKGAIGKIADAIAEFVKDPFKAIVNGLLRVLGIPPGSFWSMVDRLGDVVGAIAKDPVKFGKTLISGAAQGFKQFFEHFPTHLKEILMGWLFGTMGTAGVPMPTDFSGPGIMVTVLGIVGIDTGMISSMLGADVSDPAEMAEVHQELAGVLSGDPHALVNLFREHFDPASLIPMIKEAAMSFLIQALIMAVAPRIAAMLVPGGAILTAVEAIFKVLMWVINNAARIFTLIESLVATAGQAVAGNVSGVAAGVESGLVQIIVLVIDFLASYLGLGGLGAKLKGVIMKVSGKLKGVLKKVLDAIKKRAKAKAKTKHDPHKPAADKKPDGDQSSPTHPSKQDDHDPQKAKDAKDPRNHKPDADDKDPRNHKPDADDKDPRTHKPDDAKKPKHHHDDHDPKKRKKDGDPKKKDEDKDKDKDKDMDKRPHAVGATIPFMAGGRRHRLYVEMLGKIPVLMVASHPLRVENRLADWESRASALPSDAKQEARITISSAQRKLHDATARLKAEANASRASNRAPASAHRASVNAEEVLKDELKKLMDMFGEDDTGAAAERLVRALGIPTLSPPNQFNRDDWKQAFKVERETFRTDMKYGISKGKVVEIGDSYTLNSLTDIQIIAMVVNKFTSNGPSASQFKPAPFPENKIIDYCVHEFHESIPTKKEFYTTPRSTEGTLQRQIIAELLHRNLLKRPAEQHNMLEFPAMPARRHLPLQWDSDDIRLKFYLNGISYPNIREKVILRDTKRMRKCLQGLKDAIKNGDEGAELNMKMEYDSLRRQGLFDNDFDRDRDVKRLISDFINVPREVDHDPALAQHWCTGGPDASPPGNNCNSAQRRSVASGMGDGGEAGERLAWTTKEYNRSQSGRGHHFTDKWWVGPDFANPGTDAQYAAPGVKFSDTPRS